MTMTLVPTCLMMFVNVCLDGWLSMRFKRRQVRLGGWLAWSAG
jgi:hypothetical protein